MAHSTRECPQCGTVMVPGGPNCPDLVCRPCRNARRRELRAAKYAANPDLCEECGDVLPYRWANKVTCSKPCADRRERRREGWMVNPYYAECSECPALFWKTRQDHNFCSDLCGQRASYRRRRASERWLADRDAYNRSYAAQNPDVLRAARDRRRARLASALSLPISSEQYAARLIGFGGCCWICGGDFEAWDHVKPLAAGGPNILANLRPICGTCNSTKGAKWYGVEKLSDLAFAVRTRRFSVHSPVAIATG